MQTVSARVGMRCCSQSVPKRSITVSCIKPHHTFTLALSDKFTTWHGFSFPAVVPIHNSADMKGCCFMELTPCSPQFVVPKPDACAYSGFMSIVISEMMLNSYHILQLSKPENMPNLLLQHCHCC